MKVLAGAVLGMYLVLVAACVVAAWVEDERWLSAGLGVFLTADIASRVYQARRKR